MSIEGVYLLQTMLATVCVLVLAAPGGAELLAARLLDTAIACGTVLVFGAFGSDIGRGSYVLLSPGVRRFRWLTRFGAGGTGGNGDYAV